MSRLLFIFRKDLEVPVNFVKHHVCLIEVDLGPSQYKDGLSILRSLS